MAKSTRIDNMLSNALERPKRTAAGDAFTDLVLEVAFLGGLFTAVGETLADTGNQTLARWVILDAIEDKPSTVAQLARRRMIARQAVQRVADLLVRERLAAYEPNPQHRRAKLLRPTPQGRRVLRTITVEQKAWADALGAEIGEAKLRSMSKAIQQIRRAVTSKGLPGNQSARRRIPAWRPTT